MHLFKVPNPFFLPFTIILWTTAHYNNSLHVRYIPAFSGTASAFFFFPLRAFFSRLLLCFVPLIFCLFYIYWSLLWTGGFFCGRFFLNFDLASPDKDLLWDHQSMCLAAVNEAISKLIKQYIIPWLSVYLQRWISLKYAHFSNQFYFD